MYGFDLGLFARDHLRQLRRLGGWYQVPALLRPPLALLAAFLFLCLQLVHRLAFLLDDLLFPAWRTQPVEAPVFIVGAPRSGTTWLHRLLSQDGEHFTSMALAELLYAPAVCQKLLVARVRALDRLLGRPVERLLRFAQDRGPDHVEGIHDFDLFEPEEDELLLIHLWAGFHQTLFFPFAEEHRDAIEFDQRVPAARRAGLMGFYKDMLRKHLYASGTKARYLSKNPGFSGKVLSLAEAFPDASLVIALRTPDAVVPSTASLLDRIATLASIPPADRPGTLDRLLATLEHFYHRPSDLAPGLFPGRWCEVRYEALRADLAGEIGALYRLLGAAPGDGFRAYLEAETARARAYASRHEYRLEDLGLDPAALRTRLASVYRRFGFP